jgi:putative FmdB family regulatory protein
MPRYEFHCETCGPFEQWRPFEAATTPMLSPSCGTAVKRLYSIPGLVKTPPALLRALAGSEKSMYEPEVVVREPPKRVEAPHSITYCQTHGRPWQAGH